MLRAIWWLLLAVTSGYILGRYSGITEGERRGSAYAPLQLKADALRQQRCPVCSQDLTQKHFTKE